MQIVIDIPEDLYKKYVDVNIGRGNGKTIIYTLLRAIKNGTPLPKGHGDLIDREKLKAYINGWYDFMIYISEQPYVTFKQEEIMGNIDFMTPIIEADKEN